MSRRSHLMLNGYSRTRWLCSALNVEGHQLPRDLSSFTSLINEIKADNISLIRSFNI